MTTYTIKEMQNFLWDAFSDADATGVNIEDVLTGAKFVGVKLTDDQVKSVVDHYYNTEAWTDNDEEIRDQIADATDSENADGLYQWLAWVVGDQTAADMVENWEEN